MDRIRKLADNCTGLQVENSFLMLALVEMVRMIMVVKDNCTGLQVEFLCFWMLTVVDILWKIWWW